jgi:hypothetical protein
VAVQAIRDAIRLEFAERIGHLEDLLAARPSAAELRAADLVRRLEARIAALSGNSAIQDLHAQMRWQDSFIASLASRCDAGNRIIDAQHTELEVLRYAKLRDTAKGQAGAL